MRRRAVPRVRLAGLGPNEGLSPASVAERRQRWGPNDIVETPPRPWRAVLRETAADPMLWFLAGTSALYGVLGQRVESLTLLAVLAPLLGMDAILHRRITASTSGLASRLASRATVLRESARVVVPAAELVAGDLAVVVAGEPFPADGLVVAGADLQADEAILTGEAWPVRKRPLEALPPGDAPAVADEHWGYAGTRLLVGEARLRIVFTGAETLYGEIVRSATRDARSPTPLQAAIGKLVGTLTAGAAVLCLVLAAVRVRQGFGMLDALVSAATLAVAALPEEFPVVFTVFLGVGVYRLARRQALVRRAVSVENVGRVSCICSDKTGTITEGRLRVAHLLPAPGVERAALLALAARASRPESGDPLDTAIDEAAGARPAGETVTVFPFTEDRRRETAVVRDADGMLLAATKGAAETVLSMAALDDAERAAWAGTVATLASEGHKVVACAWRPLDAATWAGGEPDRGYRLAGVLACEDPVRPGVPAALRTCQAAGIHALMVTGDHPATATAVAREIGLGGAEPTVVSGEDLERVLADRATVLRDVDVVARALPAQKLALVRALQAAGEIVAVTGDGVNDVPALQAADVGVAMGERGARSAREAAAIVLLDDDFSTIVRAVAEGRQLFDNLRRSFLYLLAVHLPLVVTATVVPLAGQPLLWLPIHVAWLELVIHPTAMLVFQDLASGDGLAARPRARSARLLAGRDWAIVGLVGALLIALLLAGYARALGTGREVQHARAMALAALTVGSAAATLVLSRGRSRLALGLAAGSMLGTVLLVQLPGLARFLEVAPLHLDDWLLGCAGSTLAVLPLALLTAPAPSRDPSRPPPGGLRAPGAVEPRRRRA